MTNKKALQLIHERGFDTEATADGHILVRDETGMIVGKMRQHGDAHISLQKWIHAGFPKRPPLLPRYKRLLEPGDGGDAEGALFFWTDD